MLSDRRQPLFSLFRWWNLKRIELQRSSIKAGSLTLLVFLFFHLLVHVHTETKHFKDDTASSLLLSCWRKLLGNSLKLSISAPLSLRHRIRESDARSLRLASALMSNRRDIYFVDHRCTSKNQWWMLNPDQCFKYLKTINLILKSLKIKLRSPTPVLFFQRSIIDLFVKRVHSGTRNRTL